MPNIYFRGKLHLNLSWLVWSVSKNSSNFVQTWWWEIKTLVKNDFDNTLKITMYPTKNYKFVIFFTLFLDFTSIASSKFARLLLDFQASDFNFIEHMTWSYWVVEKYPIRLQMKHMFILRLLIDVEFQSNLPLPSFTFFWNFIS